MSETLFDQIGKEAGSSVRELLNLNAVHCLFIVIASFCVCFIFKL